MENKRKLKIVIGINDFIVGGAQKLIADLICLFDKEEFEFHLITLIQFEGKDTFYNLLPENVVVHKMNFRDFRDFKEWRNLYTLLKKIKPDIVWSHVFFSNTVFRIVRLFIRYRIITVEHNTYTWKNFLQKLTDKILSFWTYRIVAVSKTVANFTSNQELIPLKKFVVIYNGINLVKGREEIAKYNKKDVKREIGFQESDKLIISVGRLLGQKNHSLLISAFNLFIKNCSDYKLIILGEGSLRDTIQSQINSLGLEDRVFLLGNQEDIYKYYCASEFFMLTSKIEGFGIVGIEAMLSGLPMISTDVAGPDEYIKEGKNGFLVEENSEKIAEKMLVLANLSTEEREKFVRNAIKTAESFSIQNTANEYESLFLGHQN